MSKENAAKFFVAITKSPVLFEKMREIYGRHMGESNDPSMAVQLVEKEIIPLAKSFQFDFTPEEFILVNDEIELSSEKEVLDDDVLADVAGGKSNKGVAVALSALALAPLAMTSASAFDAPSHSYTTESGVEIARQFNEDYKKFFTEDFKKKLIDLCNLPDKDENDGQYCAHFYEPNTGLNFKGTSDTALSRLKIHYASAVVLYKEGNFEKAYEELARALHYLEDLNTPVHTHNKSIITAAFDAPDHQKFEAYCDKIRREMTVDKVKISDADLEANKYMSITDLGESCAAVANENYGKIDGKGKYSKNVDKVAKETIMNAQIAVVKALDMFYRDVVNVPNYEVFRFEVNNLSDGYVAERRYSATDEVKVGNEYVKCVFVTLNIKKGTKVVTTSLFRVDFKYDKAGKVVVTDKSIVSGKLDSIVQIRNKSVYVKKLEDKVNVSVLVSLLEQKDFLCTLLGLNWFSVKIFETPLAISCDSNGDISF